MKKFLIPILTIPLIASGCLANDNFAKKESCFKQKEVLQKESNNIWETFYSKKTDSCLYTHIETSVTDNQPRSNGVITDYKLIDIFSNEEIFSLKGCDGELHCGSSRADALKEFENKVKAYK